MQLLSKVDSTKSSMRQHAESQKLTFHQNIFKYLLKYVQEAQSEVRRRTDLQTQHTYEYLGCKMTLCYHFILIHITCPSPQYSSLFAVARVFKMKLVSLRKLEHRDQSLQIFGNKHDGVLCLGKSHLGHNTSGFSTQVFLRIFAALTVLNDVPVLLLV